MLGTYSSMHHDKNTMRCDSNSSCVCAAGWCGLTATGRLTTLAREEVMALTLERSVTTTDFDAAATVSSSL